MAVVDDRLTVATEQRDGGPRLPTFEPGSREGLDDLAREAAERLAPSGPIYLEQLYTFASGAFAGSPSIVVSYLALVSDARRLDPGAGLIPVEEATALLSGVEREVVEYAVVRLRAKIGYTTLAFHLMPFEFTLSELQRTYETILDVTLDKRNFRRRMLASGLVSGTESRRSGANHRPAALYQFTAGHDPSAFLTPTATSRTSVAK